MSRFRKKRNQPSVSLFPFLAVLICTLGVLIVMLVLAVKSAEVAKEEHQATQDLAATQKVEEAKLRLEVEKFRSESIHEVRADVLKQLADSRQNRSYLQQDIADATEDLDAANKQLQSLKRSLANANNANQTPIDQSELKAKEASLDKLKQQIVAAKQALADQQMKSKEQGPTRFSLVPFRGSGGTYRRPIFLECLENQVRLQPLGITLTKQDFALPIRAGNPLDVALLTIQEHWQQIDSAGEQGSPYPLLVVRPGGAETFVLARRAMKSWADEFGYELVAAEKDLDFGTRDSVLASKVDTVIQQSIKRQMQLAQQMYERERHLSQFSSGRGGRGFSVAKRGGGSVTTSAYQSSGGGRSASSIGFDSRGGTSGSRDGFAETQQTSYLGNGNSNSQSQSANEFAGSRSQSNPNSQSRFDASNSYSRNGTGSSNGQPNSTQRNRNAGTSNKFTSQGNISGGNSTQSGSQANSSQQSSSQASSSSSSPNLASRRGAGWALPSRNQGGTGYLRPITVVCSADHLRIKTAAGVSRTINFESGSVAAVDVMVEEIWKRIDSWGIAGQGSFWKPQLRIQVDPGGEQRFATLQHMLQNSGLVIGTGANQ